MMTIRVIFTAMILVSFLCLVLLQLYYSNKEYIKLPHWIEEFLIFGSSFILGIFLMAFFWIFLFSIVFGIGLVGINLPKGDQQCRGDN